MININIKGVLTLPSIPARHKDFLPTSSGLYFVVVCTPEPQVVYIGKAKNFSQRWSNHHRQPEVNLLEKLGLSVDIYWLESRVDDKILSQWENQLIKDLSPALNDTLTMTIEVERLENKIAQLEEFVLPDLAELPSPSVLLEQKKKARLDELKLTIQQSDALMDCTDLLQEFVGLGHSAGWSLTYICKTLGVSRGGNNPKYNLVKTLFDEFKVGREEPRWHH